MRELFEELKGKIRAYNFFKNYALRPMDTLKQVLLESNDALTVDLLL